jgi:hypothetical protein
MHDSLIASPCCVVVCFVLLESHALLLFLFLLLLLLLVDLWLLSGFVTSVGGSHASIAANFGSRLTFSLELACTNTQNKCQANTRGCCNPQDDATSDNGTDEANLETSS